MNGDLEHRLRQRIDTLNDRIAERDTTITVLRQLLKRSYNRTRWYRNSRNQWRQRSGGDGYETALKNLQNPTTGDGPATLDTTAP